MPPKAAVEEPEAQEEEQEEAEPEEPEILKKCLRSGTQTYYGDCKQGYGARKGTFVRHGVGRQVSAAVTPAGCKTRADGTRCGVSNIAYETSVMGVYEGRWADDVMSGQGVYSWSDGSSYDGAFLNGKLHGEGRFKWTDGSVYDGTWNSGQMSGIGRVDFRFDESFQQGVFQQDAFQNDKQEWVAVFQQAREMEQKQLLVHDAQAKPIVKRCACGEMCARNPQQSVISEQISKLADSIASAQNQGYIPFIMADESLKKGLLECLTVANLTNHATQSVSMRVAAIGKRRKHDFNRMFYNAIQASLRSGSLFTLVFEDDDEGISLLANEDDGWFARQPSLTPATKPLPKDWQFRHYFHPNAFPPELLQPTLFNGRMMSKLFLPDDLHDTSALTGMPAPAGQGSLAPDGETPDEAEPVPASVQGMSAAQAAQAAAALPPVGGLGLTGHVFELPDVSDARSVGLRTIHHLRPAIVALACLPSGLRDDEVSGQVVERFMNHVPMGRTMLILLTHDSTTEPPTAFDAGTGPAAYN